MAPGTDPRNPRAAAAKRPAGRRVVPAGEVPRRISKPERLLNLVAFLLSSRTAVPFSRIKGRVAGYDDDATPEALEKRFDRDKAELRALGVPIRYEPMDEHGHEGYRIPREQYFLPEIRLSVGEAAVLAVLQRYAEEASGDPLSRALASALRKVQVDSPLTGAAAASVTEQHMLGVKSEQRPGELSANLALLSDAVLLRRAARFKYHGIAADTESEREVCPYGLGSHGGRWYLVAFDRGKDAIRHFRVDRIRGRARLIKGKPFPVPEDFDVADHVGRPAFLLRRDGEGERVAIEVSPEVAFLARDALRRGWTFEDLPTGGGLLQFDADDRPAVIRFVAKHAERARIVSPPDLREEAVAHFRSMLRRYEGPPTDVPGRPGRSARAAKKRKPRKGRSK